MKKISTQLRPAEAKHNANAAPPKSEHELEKVELDMTDLDKVSGGGGRGGRPRRY